MTPEILLFGDPRLRETARACDLEDPSLARQIADMHGALNSFRLAQGWGRGLAAPQIGLPIRAVALNLDGRAVTLLDPEITWRSVEQAVAWDDCFSLPEISAPVIRHASVTVAFRDEAGRRQEFARTPFDLAELLQHELDHLDGVLFVDRAVAPKYVVSRTHRDSASKQFAGELGAHLF